MKEKSKKRYEREQKSDSERVKEKTSREKECRGRRQLKTDAAPAISHTSTLEHQKARTRRIASPPHTKEDTERREEGQKQEFCKGLSIRLEEVPTKPWRGPPGPSLVPPLKQHRRHTTLRAGPAAQRFRFAATLYGLALVLRVLRETNHIEAGSTHLDPTRPHRNILVRQTFQVAARSISRCFTHLFAIHTPVYCRKHSTRSRLRVPTRTQLV
ncbi:hypothetical protein H6P81_010019 [Aristolochia fimbriata]|uniref:Uncharacterized protein n=1 Tax=Aristolochia fimbriata TaxID=158543 RepID=A0AAV7ENR9_ARIFI|nr:hypothetical protein H6P81_010019 [Aristolochia fimbriata]